MQDVAIFRAASAAVDEVLAETGEVDFDEALEAAIESSGLDASAIVEAIDGRRSEGSLVLTDDDVLRCPWVGFDPDVDFGEAFRSFA